MEDYQQRVIEEKKELDEKISKLKDFGNTLNFTQLATVEQGLLRLQLVAMNNYSDVLGQRIDLF